MEVGKLEAAYRGDHGKTPSRRLRVTGQVPAVIYGLGGEPLSISVDGKSVLKALDPQKKVNTLIALTVKDAPSGTQNLTVMVREYQKSALKGELTHIDFVRVDPTKPVYAVVPLAIVGKAKGVVDGGILHQTFHKLELSALPDKIPAKIELDVTHLGIGDAFHVSDLKLADGIKPRVDGGVSLCSVTAPHVEKAAAESAVVADAAAATSDKGAAAAKGAAGSDKGAAKADAKGAAKADAKGGAAAKGAKK
jgi:large subunit ribosomal protein L25